MNQQVTWRQLIIPVLILVGVLGPLLVWALSPLLDGLVSEAETCPNEEEWAYFSQVEAIFAAVSPHNDGLAKQLEQIVENPLVMAQNDWKRETAIYIVGQQEVVADVRELSPPSSTMHVHNLHLRAVDALEDSTEAVIYGVDNMDGSSFRRAEAATSEYIRLLEEVRTEVDTFCR